MEFPTVMNWTLQFPISVLLGGILNFIQILKINFCKQTVESLILFCGDDLVLHCLPMSHKKDARLILVNALALLYLNQGPTH